jgi:hypothetical protein
MERRAGRREIEKRRKGDLVLVNVKLKFYINQKTQSLLISSSPFLLFFIVD